MPIRLAVLRRWRQLFAFLLISLLAVAPAAADPSGRVGRIAWLSGSVHLHRSDSGESSSALLNWPISTGDVLSTGAGARGEVQIGSTLLQLDSGSVLDFVQVDDQRVHLRLLEGSVIARLRSADAASEFEISTREGRFRARDAGSYRFDSDRTVVTATVAAGSLLFEASDRAVEVSAGQRVQFWNDGGTHQHVSAPANDDFALWSAGRDRPVGNSGHSRYVSPEMTGAADLDAYGSWSDNAEYGPVWFPRAVAADWAPYRTGRWVWVAPWGWTWVGDEPWGFAPFHYGRWVLYGGAWGWVPGRRVARPVYAPALVAWVGTPGVGVSVQVGARPAVGWFPLAPREVYVPPYRSSERYVRQVNVTHVTQINNITNITSNPQAAVARMPYAHRQQPRAVTMVPADVVSQHRPVSGAAMLPRDRQQLASQPVQVQAPVAAPPVDAQRRPAGERPFEPGRREREAGRRPPADAPVGGRAEQRQQMPVTGATPPVGAAPAAEPAAQPPARTPPGTIGGLPAPAGRPVAAPAARGGEPQGAGRPPAEAAPGGGGRARPEVAPPVGSPAQPAVAVPPTPSPSVAPGGRPVTAPPVGSPASPRDVAPSPSPPLLAPAERIDRAATQPVRRPPESREPRESRDLGAGAAGPGAATPLPSAPGRREQNGVPTTPAARSPSAVGTTGPDRPAAAAGRPWPQPERAEPRPAAPLTVPAQSPAGGPPRAERPAGEVDRAAPAVRPARPEQRIEVPAQPLPAPSLPAAPRSPERPVATPGQPIHQPGAQRSDPRMEQRRPDPVPSREDPFARPGRQEMPAASAPAPMAMPQRPAAPGRVDSPAANERQVRPDRRQESGAGGQRQRPGDGRDGREDRLPRGADG